MTQQNLLNMLFLLKKKKLLRWSETKKLKISIPDNIFFLYLVIIKFFTLKQLENIHQKLKLILSQRRGFHGNH